MLGIFQQIQGRNSDAEVLAHSSSEKSTARRISAAERESVHRLLECAIKFGAQALANQRTSLFFRCRRRIAAFAVAVLKFRSGFLSLVVHYGYQFIRVASDDRAGA